MNVSRLWQFGTLGGGILNQEVRSLDKVLGKRPAGSDMSELEATSRRLDFRIRLRMCHGETCVTILRQDIANLEL